MKSKDLEIENLYFEVNKEDNICGFGFGIVLRVANKSNENQPIRFIQEKTTLASSKYGMKLCYHFDPHQVGYDDYIIIGKSFVDIGISFGEKCNKLYDGDKIQIAIKNICNIHIQRENSKWVFLEIEDKQTNNDALLEIVECLESLEESMGISIQNVSINVNNAKSIDLFFEVLGVDDKCKEDGFTLKYAIYDKKNKIRKIGEQSKREGEFIGFEIFVFEDIELPMPAKEIGKIRIYPTKY